ncbi:MAG TPA: DUF5709 domain-containing protein [Jatrophihabitans sp.]|jgi:hypothetical protein
MNDSDLYGDSVYEDGVEDTDDFDPASELTGEDLEEPLDTGYSPPEHRPAATRYGTTDREQVEGESLDQRLAEEEPDTTDDEGSDASEDPRAGRLVAPDEGAHDADEEDEIGYDVGRAGNAASSEEAAMHLVGEDALNEQDSNEDDIGR